MKIFESRAHTAEAKLQVELAQYRYEIPSLKGLGHQDVAYRRRHRHARPGRDGV